jgi:hypothetical protein
MNTTRAWHFTGDTLRNGSPIPKPGETLVWTGPLVLCRSGFHASLHPFDALQYAPGPRLHLVEMSGNIRHGGDKLVATERTIVASMDATEMLQYFARTQAISCLDAWDAPDVVLDWLMTGDPEHQSAAWAAAESAAWAAARSAAWAAARSAAWAAAESAAWAAARSAAWAAARSAAWAEARSAARADFESLVHECFEFWR